MVQSANGLGLQALSGKDYCQVTIKFPSDTVSKWVRFLIVYLFFYFTSLTSTILWFSKSAFFLLLLKHWQMSHQLIFVHKPGLQLLQLWNARSKFSIYSDMKINVFCTIEKNTDSLSHYSKKERKHRLSLSLSLFTLLAFCSSSSNELLPYLFIYLPPIQIC